MLGSIEIDTIKETCSNGNEATLYYVCDYGETRDHSSDSDFKTIHKYKVIEVIVTDVLNGFREFKDYKLHPENYHVETEREYYDYSYAHVINRKYTTRNTSGPFDKDLNPRIPSRIFGEKKEYIKDGELVVYEEPSPVTPYYTNNLRFKDKDYVSYTDPLIQWKYDHLTNPITVDGINFNYVYSNYYILITKNMPTVEYPLVCVTDINCPYFMSLEEAWDFVKQCEA